MKIAFYAPMKPVDHPIPSGDRRMARLIIDALTQAGHRVEIASTLRSYDGSGDLEFQQEIQKRGWLAASNYVKNHQPDLWFTYHLYHKAPDWIGPVVAQRQKIPYVVAEASYAPKQSGGKWDLNHKSVESALRQCQRVYQLNPDDGPCVKALISNTSGPIDLPPFLNSNDFDRNQCDIDTFKSDLVGEFGLDPAKPWVVVAAMMREGDKYRSYELLAKALKNLNKGSFQLLVCGEGPCEEKTKALFKERDDVFYLGLQNQEKLRHILFASDMFIWPGINEAFGLALLEAQAAGLPVVAGNNPGIANMIKQGETGILTPMGDITAFADAIRHLLENPNKRLNMGKLAAAHVAGHHDIASAAEIFARTLPN